MQFGLIGGRLGHSYSCEIHEAIADYKYELKELKPEELPAFFEKREFTGINVTIPYKQDVIPYLYEISDKARSIGAVNTIVNKDGRLYGYNTDFYGMTELLRVNGIEIEGRKVLILGTGGTSKTARAVAKSLGARETVIVSRKASDETVTYEDAVKNHSDAEIIINTTPVGMFPKEDEKPVDISAFPSLQGVADAIYNPLRTDIVLDAMERGLPASGGLYMLSAQGVLASSLFQGREVSESLVEKAFRQVENTKKNIVLIGMPASGKSSIGRLIAAKTGRKFTDTDDITTEIIGMPIADYIRTYGEAKFRAAEKEAVKRASASSGMVIATGGGAVLDKDNVRALRRNGTIVFLDRSLDNLIVTSDRPLSSDREKLKNLYDVRLPVYRAAADFTADSDQSVEEAAHQIITELKL